MKNTGAYKTIGEVSEMFDLKPHVIRFWEDSFVQLKPLKRKGGRRLYSVNEINLIRRIKELLYDQKYTIKGVKNYLSSKKMAQVKEEGIIKLNKETISQLNEIKRLQTGTLTHPSPPGSVAPIVRPASIFNERVNNIMECSELQG